LFIVCPSLQGGPAWYTDPNANASQVSFPDHSRVPSPDGRYVLVGVDSDTEPHHAVFLEDTLQKTSRKLFSYDQHVKLLWNHESTLIAVTTFTGNESSKCMVVSVDEKLPIFRALDWLYSPNAPKEMRDFLTNRHAYVEAEAWTGPMELDVKVWGYGQANPSGFTQYNRVYVHFGP
jgi:hypothetical protein